LSLPSSPCPTAVSSGLRCRLPLPCVDSSDCSYGFGFSIAPAGVGSFWGFGVSGPNKCFLLADYTVAHNSTILKQMKILHLDGFKSPEEKAAYKALVWKNLLESMQTLCHACDTLKISLDSDENRARSSALLALSVNDSPLPHKSDIQALWHDTGVQKAVARSSEFHLLDSAPYFLESSERVLQASFEPNTQDILRSRIATTGIIETEFTIDKLLFRMYDVGGQRGERKKWIHCFENVTAIMFIASLSEYDQVLAEDRCLRVDQLVRLADGQSLPAGQVCAGMHLAGVRDEPLRVIGPLFPHSHPRSVNFYRVTHEDGSAYVVKQGHPITLVANRNPSLLDEQHRPSGKHAAEDELERRSSLAPWCGDFIDVPVETLADPSTFKRMLVREQGHEQLPRFCGVRSASAAQQQLVMPPLSIVGAELDALNSLACTRPSFKLVCLDGSGKIFYRSLREGDQARVALVVAHGDLKGTHATKYAYLEQSLRILALPLGEADGVVLVELPNEHGAVRESIQLMLNILRVQKLVVFGCANAATWRRANQLLRGVDQFHEFDDRVTFTFTPHGATSTLELGSGDSSFAVTVHLAPLPCSLAHVHGVEETLLSAYGVSGGAMERVSIRSIESEPGEFKYAKISVSGPEERFLLSDGTVTHNTRNRLKESLDLFEGIINLPWFKDAPVILFLNKDDLFRKKIDSVDIGIYFPQYTGGTEYSLGLKFIQDEYFARNLNETKTIYCHVTDATNTENIAFVWKATKHIILEQNLTRSGLLMC